MTKINTKSELEKIKNDIKNATRGLDSLLKRVVDLENKTEELEKENQIPIYDMVETPNDIVPWQWYIINLKFSDNNLVKIIKKFKDDMYYIQKNHEIKQSSYSFLSLKDMLSPRVALIKEIPLNLLMNNTVKAWNNVTLEYPIVSGILVDVKNIERITNPYGVYNKKENRIDYYKYIELIDPDNDYNYHDLNKYLPA